MPSCLPHLSPLQALATIKPNRHRLHQGEEHEELEVDEMEVGGGAEMSVNDTSGQRQRNRLVCIKKYLMGT